VYLGRDDHGIFEMRAAMDHAVPHRIDVRAGGNGARRADKQCVQKVLDDALARCNGQLFGEDAAR
jgi:hypothetical protein